MINKYIERVFGLVIAVCIAIALFADVKSTGNLSMALNGNGITQFITFVFLVIGIFQFKKFIQNYKISKRNNIFYCLLSFLFSICMIIGRWKIAHEDLKYIIIAIPMFIGYITLFWGLIILVDCYVIQKIIKMKDKEAGKVSKFVFEKHALLAPMVIVWLFRLPWMIAFYPCTTSWDGAIQIRNFYGREIFTNHHPPLVSFLYGNIAWHSNALGIDNIGMFMIPVLQVLISSFAVAKACQLMKKLVVPYWMRWCALLYYAAFTVWCIFDCTIIKDTLYYPFAMLFATKVIECLVDAEEFFRHKVNLIMLIIYGILMTQIRNNGVYVLILTLPFLIIILKKKRKLIMTGGLVASLICIWILENCVYPSFGVINLEDKVDKYCIMFQQTAKYSIEHPDDVTEEERKILNQLFDYDELAEVYNPYLADWVKNCLRVQEGVEEDPTNSIFASLKDDYMKVWFAQFCRHPFTYIEAFLECSYGYYYPELRVYKEGYGMFELSHDLLTQRMSNISQIESLSTVRFLFEQLDKLEYVPGIGMFYRCGFYTWILLFIIIFLWKDRYYKALIGCIPVVVNVLVCLISPVNTCIRYAMPTMCLIPILLAWFYSQYQKGAKES